MVAPSPAPQAVAALSEEQRGELTEAFELFDTERCGRIDYHQLKIAMRALGFDVRKADVLRIMGEHGVTPVRGSTAMNVTNAMTVMTATTVMTGTAATYAQHISEQQQPLDGNANRSRPKNAHPPETLTPNRNRPENAHPPETLTPKRSAKVARTVPSRRFLGRPLWVCFLVCVQKGEIGMALFIDMMALQMVKRDPEEELRKAKEALTCPPFWPKLSHAQSRTHPCFPPF
jgi:Ca2+-binding EF-hand superfamily protein